MQVAAPDSLIKNKTTNYLFINNYKNLLLAKSTNFFNPNVHAHHGFGSRKQWYHFLRPHLSNAMDMVDWIRLSLAAWPVFYVWL